MALLDPQGLPQVFDTARQSAPVGFDLLDQSVELTAGEARAVFYELFRDLVVRVNNQRLFDAAKRKG